MEKTLRQEYLICYDIENSKLRTKISNELKKSGLLSVQKSVFWGYLTQAELKSLYRFIASLVESNDKVFFTRTRFNSNGYSFLIGYKKDEFEDWKDSYVI